MCGIVGYVGPRRAVPVILEALRYLEYRGYDSAGLAVHTGKRLGIVRAEGKLANLVEKAYEAALPGNLAIGHTRWATHGAPTERNAHPHTDAQERVAVVHNGIVENHRELRAELAARGVGFSSDTDSEVIAHLLALEGGSLRRAALAVRSKLKGQFAVAAIARGEPEALVVFRQGPPLVIGVGEGEVLVASDPAALVPWTRRCIFLEDGDLAEITSTQVRLWDAQGLLVERPVVVLDWEPGQVERGGYRHFMLKEIHEQPGAVAETFRFLFPEGKPTLEHLGLEWGLLRQVSNVFLVGCGTSWHAALVGKFFVERLAKVPTHVDYASEFRYRQPPLPPKSLFLGITQSGETADTLAAMRLAQEAGVWLGALCNVRGSTAERLAAFKLRTCAGPEIGVASTKAFTTQLVALLALALALAEAKGLTYPELLERLPTLPYALQAQLACAVPMETWAEELQHASNALYLGRGVLYPIALEGALKLKEIAYIHAEGYPGGEMKHGPIALLDEHFPVIGLCPKGELEEKMLSNLEEVHARKAPLYLLGAEGNGRLEEIAARFLALPDVPWPFLPLLAVVPLQLLAYEVAVRRGCDVDQPRNLAKSVTVE